MDSLTQIALGIATAELCAGKLPARKTFLYGALLGTLPDLDVLVGKFLDPVSAVAMHRGLGHSLLFFVLLSPVLGWTISRIEGGKISFRTGSLMSFWCLFTHVLLDAFTSWGTQVLWPLPYRFALKTIFVIDPLYTVPFAICLVLAWQKRFFPLRRKYILRGLYISSLYLLITCGLKLYALQQFTDALEKANVAYDDLIVKPTAFNTILWNANVDVSDGYLLGDYSIFDSKPITFKWYEKNARLEQRLAGNEDFETLKKVSEGWYIVTKKDGLYYFNDLRFGLLNNDPAHPQFAFSYVFKEKGGILKAQEVPKQKRDGMVLSKKNFKRMWGN